MSYQPKVTGTHKEVGGADGVQERGSRANEEVSNDAFLKSLK